MEPRPDEKKGQQPRPEAQPAKSCRFRVVKLEERIAPKRDGSNYFICPTHAHGCKS
jgi:hypothetical protein